MISSLGICILLLHVGLQTIYASTAKEVPPREPSGSETPCCSKTLTEQEEPQVEEGRARVQPTATPLDSDVDIHTTPKQGSQQQVLKIIQKRPAEPLPARGQGGAPINPQNARHPELHIPEDKQGEPGKGRTSHTIPLLPNMYSPIQIPVHFPPYYHILPYPFHIPAYNTGTAYEDGFPFVNEAGLRYAGRIPKPGGFPNFPGPFNQPGYGIRPASGQMRLPSHTFQMIKEGQYGDRVEVNRPRIPTLHEENLDEEEIISGKFRPCGGECTAEEFLCVGSCYCIPKEFRCDGKIDCSGSQDELECGEAELDADLPCLKENDDYRCPRSGKCIKKIWLCDGDDDCGDFSDETHCNGRNCTEAEFECTNGLCIERGWVCDGDNDCKDNTDEINCTKRVSCSNTEYKCGDGNCISLLWKCDGEPDCSDGSDEGPELCPQEPRVCGDNEFECTYPRCIRLDFVCDGDDDCGDWSDENNCPPVEGSCGPQEFSCPSGRCISERWRCDEEVDCDDGEDEANCTTKTPKPCSDDEFSCDNGYCILRSWLCDSVTDCIHGEDEKDCVQKCDEAQFDCAAHHTNVSATNHSIQSHLNCINKKHVCDGKRDCPAGEDEESCPVIHTCAKDSKCEQTCVTLGNGQNGCSCGSGFALRPDGYRCRDVDECLFESEPVCSQICTNNFGSFICSCMKGYALRPDGRTCKALGEPATLIFANRIDIRELSLNSRKYTAILKGLENAIALDFHYDKKLIFWSDVSKDIIRRATLEGNEKEVVVKWGLETPGGVTIDWVHNLLFWTDAGTRRVEVATLEGNFRYVVAAHDLDKPRAIANHPEKGILFWTDWGPRPKIERANMDGSNRKMIVKESLAWPNGLTIDYPMARIYWADAKHHVIESAMLDGSDRKKVISKGLPHPFAVTIFEDALFWTDWHTKSIATASKDSGIGYRVLHSGLHFPMDIHSFHSLRQPNFTNHCGPHNGQCSHLCLPTETSYRCVCPLGLEIQDNRKTCAAPQKMLVFARSKDIRLQQLRKDRGIDMVIPLDGILSAEDVVVDSDNEMIYWSDLDGGSISGCRINGSDQQIIFNTNLLKPGSIAHDWLTKKLYWLDWETKRIEVSNMNGSIRALLIWDGLKNPQKIALNPIHGFMYWTDWGYPPVIERAHLDGSNRVVLISDNINKPVGLTVDFDASLLFWADAGLQKIMCASIDGKSPRAVPISGVKMEYPYSIAVHETQVYWSDKDSKNIYGANKLSGQGLQTIRTGISGLAGIAVYKKQKKREIPSPCHDQPNPCSHLCLASPKLNRYTCACRVGVKLMSDGKTCAPGPRNSLIIAHRVDIRQISLDVPYITDTVLPLPPMKKAVGVDVDMKSGMIYWTDTAERVISRASSDGLKVENIVVDGLDAVGGIAVDSTGRKIYWTDDGRNSIEAAELDGSNRAVLISNGLDKPRAITLHYYHGLMFWSDWGEKPRIEKASMDGTNRKALITNNLEWPNGLAIDRPEGRLYWNDGKLKTIESCDLTGDDRRVVLEQVPHPYGLVIVGSHIYWTDWKTEGIHRADKLTGSESQIIVANISGPMDIRSVQVENIAENACGDFNGGCSHLCLRSPSSYSCVCPTGIVIQEDSMKCSHTPNAFLLFATRRSLARISLDTPDNWDVSLPIYGIHMAIAMDFHWAKQIIYYSDIHLHIIRSVNMTNNSDAHVIISGNLSTPDGLAVDWLAENMYWTDTGRKVIEVARLDGSCRKTIISKELGEPRAVAVFPRKGYLFWTDWTTDSPKIERSMMDGSSRKVIASSDLGFPNGLAIDYSAKKLYWADARKDRIETCDLNGRFRVVLVPDAKYPFGVTQFGQYIYWTNWYSKSIERADKTTGRDKVTIRSNLDEVMEIRAVAANKQSGSSPCQINNGGCTHLCLLQENSNYFCACPDEPDSRMCRIEQKIGKYNSILERKDEREEEADDVEAGSKSDLDNIHGMDFDASVSEPETTVHDPVVSQMTLVLLISSICCGVILVACIAVFLRIRQRRKEPSNLFYSGGQNVLAFSNPNYVTNQENVSDKKSFLWKKLKYDKSQERVYGVPDEKPEVTVSLMATRGMSPPPTPPKRFDSINLPIA